MRRFLILAAALLLLASCAARAPQPETIEPRTTRAPRSDEINIDYPVFPECSDEVNALIKNAAYSALDWYDLEFFEPEERLTLDIGYEIKLKTDEFVSIAFQGWGYLEGTVYPNNWFSTLTLNVETGERVQLADRVPVNTAFVEALHRAAKKTLEPERYEAYKNYYIDEKRYDLLSELAGADAEGSEFYSYFTPDSVGISVPIWHVYGDHIEIEIPNNP